MPVEDDAICCDILQRAVGKSENPECKGTFQVPGELITNSDAIRAYRRELTRNGLIGGLDFKAGVDSPSTTTDWLARASCSQAEQPIGETPSRKKLLRESVSDNSLHLSSAIANLAHQQDEETQNTQSTNTLVRTLWSGIERWTTQQAKSSSSNPLQPDICISFFWAAPTPDFDRDTNHQQVRPVKSDKHRHPTSHQPPSI